MTKGLNEQVDSFRNRSLSERLYPILWVDALYEKVRIDGRIVHMAVMVVCGVDEHGQRDILAIEPMLEESEDTYLLLFRSLQERGLHTPTGDLRCTFRSCGGNSQGFSRRKLAEMQSALHAQHSGACAPQGEKYVCASAESHLVGTHQRAGLQAGRISMPAV